jgi:hypothetical protein
MFVELAAAQAASFPVQSHSRSRILQASDIAQRDVSVHLNLIRLLRASGKEDEAAAEAALGAKIYPNLFASDRDRRHSVWEYRWTRELKILQRKLKVSLKPH